ncbi:prepilin peptidase [Legionella impletisoli]|uniref:Prepilin leader peptidase/N-methyltransferase n=1 Tax=Legionella impletisoli TaxID=343510 RepID=A0A917JM18_9GAMM|nr:A24 family peptidase [Legionella impletisoli]GGI75925.1 type 4 prepilin-like proteins leader peptide-processing enzyme [Legionella impletisoli]
MNEFILLYPITFTVLFGIFCLCVGSLLNVFIHRLPRMMIASWTEECRSFLELPEQPTEKINLFTPRSHCPECKTPIPAWHNIPILSYCVLKGRSHCCKKRISLRYPFVEGLCLVLSLFAAWHFGYTLPLVFALLFIWILIVIAFIDLQHQLIPDSLSLSLLWLGLIANTQSLFTALPSAVFGAVIGYVSLWSLIQIYYLLTGKVGMGHGDFKLLAAFGAWFGWTILPFIVLFSSLIGSIIGLIYLRFIGKSHDTPLPFGPHLCLAGFIALFYGSNIIQWYIRFYQ